MSVGRDHRSLVCGNGLAVLKTPFPNLQVRVIMRAKVTFFAVLLLLGIPFAGTWADEFDDTIEVFKEAGESASFFDNSYGYAVFPNIGKGGVGIGGARGKGRVYEQGTYIGDTTMTQLTVGFQLGGQVYSQIIFFKDKRALDDFTSGNFEFGAQATAVAITAGASAAATTTGSSAGISGGKKDAATAGAYDKGMATFTVAKGGLMYEASIGGQKFSYTPKGE
jgi:lipid-binding SYLF domain-containing protein